MSFPTHPYISQIPKSVTHFLLLNSIIKAAIELDRTHENLLSYTTIYLLVCLLPVLEDLGEKAFMLFVYAVRELDTMVWWQLCGCALDTGGTKCSSMLLTSPCHTHSSSAHRVLSVEAPGHGCSQTAVTGRGQMFAGTGRQSPHFCTLVADDRTETLMSSSLHSCFRSSESQCLDSGARWELLDE